MDTNQIHNNSLRDFLLCELSRHTFLSLHHLRRARILFTQLHTQPVNVHKAEFWYATELTLFHLGFVSRYLFPAKDCKRDQLIATEIRVLLDISDDSILADRSLRNGMEHYDERIEKWHKEQPEGAFFLYCIAPSQFFNQTHHQNMHWIIDSKRGNLHFWNKSINLVETYNILRALLSKLYPHRPIYYDFGDSAYKSLIEEHLPPPPPSPRPTGS